MRKTDIATLKQVEKALKGAASEFETATGKFMPEGIWYIDLAYSVAGIIRRYEATLKTKAKKRS